MLLLFSLWIFSNLYLLSFLLLSLLEVYEFCWSQRTSSWFQWFSPLFFYCLSHWHISWFLFIIFFLILTLVLTEFFFLNLCISDVADCLLCSCMKIYIFSSGASICYELIEAFNSRKIYEVCQVFCPFTVSSSFPTMAKTLISSHL